MILLPGMAFAANADGSTPIDLTSSSVGLFAIGIFVLAYVLVMADEFTHLHKS